MRPIYILDACSCRAKLVPKALVLIECPTFLEICLTCGRETIRTVEDADEVRYLVDLMDEWLDNQLLIHRGKRFGSA